MPYDPKTAARVRALLARREGLAEKTMFGGLGFLLNGNLCCGVWRESLILRVGPDAYEESLAHPFAREFDITGRPMRGWVMVESRGYEHDDDLKEWIEAAVRFAGSLPAKDG